MSRSPGPGGGRRRYVPDWPTNITARRRRLSRVMLLVAALVAVIVIATPVVFLGGDDDDPGAAGAAAFEERGGGWYLAGGAETVTVGVDRVVDGDTLDVRLFDGSALRVRLFGASTPEVGERCADAATARLEALAGGEVLLLADARLEDAGGRALRYAFTRAGLSIDAVLIDGGLATAWREDGAYRDALVAIEDRARDAARGCLWAGG
jgi:endonuclease YncB( thermonuclease family)